MQAHVVSARRFSRGYGPQIAGWTRSFMSTLRVTNDGPFTSRCLSCHLTKRVVFNESPRGDHVFYHHRGQENLRNEFARHRSKTVGDTCRDILDRFTQSGSTQFSLCAFNAQSLNVHPLDLITDYRTVNHFHPFRNVDRKRSPYRNAGLSHGFAFQTKYDSSGWCH